MKSEMALPLMPAPYKDPCICMKCHRIRPKADFRNDASLKASYRPYCAECYEEDLERWREANAVS